MSGVYAIFSSRAGSGMIKIRNRTKGENVWQSLRKNGSKNLCRMVSEDHRHTVRRAGGKLDLWADQGRIWSIGGLSGGVSAFCGGWRQQRAVVFSAGIGRFYGKRKKDGSRWRRRGLAKLCPLWAWILLVGRVWLFYGTYRLSQFTAGHPGPQSGSIAQNGSTMAEQIGGQIFIDTWGLVSPGNPELAVNLAEKAASVTHDGNGKYGGMFIAACISIAFIEQDIKSILEKGLFISLLIVLMPDWCGK